MSIVVEEVYCLPDEVRQVAPFIGSVFANVAACYLRFCVVLHPPRTFSLLVPKTRTCANISFLAIVIHTRQDDCCFDNSSAQYCGKRFRILPSWSTKCELITYNYLRAIRNAKKCGEFMAPLMHI